MHRHWIAVLFFAAFFNPTALAADCSFHDFDGWLQCRIEALAASNSKQSATEKQAEQPSASSASTSLVDQTSAPDLVGIGLQLAGVGQNVGSNQSGSVTVTTTAYAVVTAAGGANPLNPAIYDGGERWRRVSFTLGSEQPSQDNNQTKYKIFGGKVLLLNWRDVSSYHAKQLLKKASSTLAASNVAYQSISLQIKQYLYATLGPRIDPARYPLPPTAVARVDFLNTELDPAKMNATLGQLRPDEEKEIDRIISTRLSTFTGETRDLWTIVGQIRQAPQFSLSYAAKIADQDSGRTKTDLHRFEAIFDWGANAWTNVNVNASFDYFNSKIVGLDKRAGRIAGGVKFELNHNQAIAKGTTPFTFDINGEGNFLTKTNDIFKVQAKLTVPIANGIALPISVTTANRTELINESDVRGQFGFTVDVSKLAGLFTPK